MKAYYANQNIIQINREMPEKGTKRPYLNLYNDNLFAAMQELDGEAAIKLYLYLAANQKGFNLNFSPKHFAETCGMSLNSARTASKQLIEKGFLIQDESNHYQFYEVPQKKLNIRSAMKDEYRLIDCQEDGFIKMSYSQFYQEAKKAEWTDEEITRTWNSSKIAEEN